MILFKIEALSRERERESRTKFCHIFNDIISIENLLEAWREFLRGKRKRKDVERFSLNLSENILDLHYDLAGKTYKHGNYTAFKINDPKPRDIHKADVRDRLLHHAIYRVLYQYFDKKFIFDSFSCRINKGTHRAINRLCDFTGKVSQNHTRTVYALKCDIRKFFASIDHAILLNILNKRINDIDAIWLLSAIIKSFNTPGKHGTGLPLGNLTSQLLVNIYMNEFDHFVKRELKIKCYVRYADDFVLLHTNKLYLEETLPKISQYLNSRLNLSLHPGKVCIKTIASGVDFLGWIVFPHHRVLRTATKRRMLKKLKQNPKRESLISYHGILSHGNAYKLRRRLDEI